MNSEFEKYIANLEESFQRLLSMEPVNIASLPKNMPQAGIYLFSEGERHLYVGRSNRIRQRLQQHCRPKANHNTAPFAFRITREAVGITQATYTRKGSREDLESDPEFSNAFTEAKAHIRKMDVRFIEEGNPLKQALLEIYTAVSLRAYVLSVSALPAAWLLHSSSLVFCKASCMELPPVIRSPTCSQQRYSLQ